MQVQGLQSSIYGIKREEGTRGEICGWNKRGVYRHVISYHDTSCQQGLGYMERTVGLAMALPASCPNQESNWRCG